MGSWASRITMNLRVRVLMTQTRKKRTNTRRIKTIATTQMKDPKMVKSHKRTSKMNKTRAATRIKLAKRRTTSKTQTTRASKTWASRGSQSRRRWRKR